MHGLGFTWSHEWGDSAGSAAIGIRVERDDGSARVFGMRCDNGLCAETAYCQIAADELGFRYENVQYRPFFESIVSITSITSITFITFLSTLLSILSSTLSSSSPYAI